MGKNWSAKLGLDQEDPSIISDEEEEFASKQVSASSKQVSAAARESLDFLAGLLMPTVFRYLFPDVFKSIWNLLTEKAALVRDFSQIAIGLPRGFGKTMVIKLYVCYCIFFTKKQFILIICGTFPKAVNILSDIMMMLSERNVISVFGDWRIGSEVSRQELKKFTLCGRSIILAAAGAQSDIRGITLNNERPDVIIFDDIQTREDADSEEISSKIETWMVGTAMKAKSPHGCLFIFIANMYPTVHSILRKLKTNRQWIKFIAGGILAKDGKIESLWEDLQPLQQLLNEYENDSSIGHPEIFHAEVLNDENASVNNLIDLSKIPKFPVADGEISTGSFILIDPSTDKDKSDGISLGYFEIHNEKPLMFEVEEFRDSPLGIIDKAFSMAFKWNCRYIICEADSFQYTLQFWFDHVMTQRGYIGFHIRPIYSQGKNKVTSIISMFKQLLKGELNYHPRCEAAVVSQIMSFNPLKQKNNDGVLDLLKYAPQAIALYGQEIISQNIIDAQEMDTQNMVLENNSPF